MRRGWCDMGAGRHCARRGSAVECAAAEASYGARLTVPPRPSRPVLQSTLGIVDGRASEAVDERCGDIVGIGAVGDIEQDGPDSRR